MFGEFPSSLSENHEFMGVLMPAGVEYFPLAATAALTDAFLLLFCSWLPVVNVIRMSTECINY